MIISWLTGGLGNQMFQYAAGLALAEHRRTVLKLDPSWFRDDPAHAAHNRYSLSCFNITEQFATQEEIERVRGVNLTTTERWSLAVARSLRFYRYANRYAAPANWHQPPTFRFYPEFFAQPDNTYLNGMFQSEQFFAPVEKLLRAHFSFRYPASPEVAALAAQIRSGPSAAIHFRRGDYVRDQQFNRELGVIGRDYYSRAVQLLRERSPEATLYLFSDDIEAVAAEFRPSGPHHYVRAGAAWHAWDELRLMSLCDHQAIANSSFSWWAAWLNLSPTKLVLAPDPWFAHSEHDATDLVPATWTKLSLRSPAP
ncbi:MAG: alpha-1,2-fucosyltransferase [Candidatus Didemnitutus sp.]|nr:alpha-1,2-fucosyltransferase [Candidatus Didemnitutus sp.]